MNVILYDHDSVVIVELAKGEDAFARVRGELCVRGPDAFARIEDARGYTRAVLRLVGGVLMTVSDGQVHVAPSDAPRGRPSTAPVAPARRAPLYGEGALDSNVELQRAVLRLRGAQARAQRAVVVPDVNDDIGDIVIDE